MVHHAAHCKTITNLKDRLCLVGSSLRCKASFRATNHYAWHMKCWKFSVHLKQCRQQFCQSVKCCFGSPPSQNRSSILFDFTEEKEKKKHLKLKVYDSVTKESKALRSAGQSIIRWCGEERRDACVCVGGGGGQEIEKRTERRGMENE